MSDAAPAQPNKSVAVTILGWSTVLLGGAIVALGGGLIITGVGLQNEPVGTGPFRGLAQAAGNIVTACGVVLLLSGLLVLVAGRGVVLRKNSGRVLTFIVAVIAILLGLLPLAFSALDFQRSGALRPEPALILYCVIGAALILYGIPTFVILIRNGAEFSITPQGGHCRRDLHA